MPEATRCSKWYAMWHPVLKWGGPAPVLMQHKRQAALSSGVSLPKIREMGWRWVVVEVNEPGIVYDNNGVIQDIYEYSEEDGPDTQD